MLEADFLIPTTSTFATAANPFQIFPCSHLAWRSLLRICHPLVRKRGRALLGQWDSNSRNCFKAAPNRWLLFLFLATIFKCSRSEEHTSELQSHHDLVCRLLLEKKKPSARDRT